MIWEPLVPVDPQPSEPAVPRALELRDLPSLLLVSTVGVLPTHVLFAFDAQGAEHLQTFLGFFLGLSVLVSDMGIAAALAGRVPLTTLAMIGHGLRRFESAAMSTLTLAVRLSVGVVLFVIPGVVWLLQSTFLAQAAALHPDDVPFTRSRATVRGHLAATLGLALLRGVATGGVDAGGAIARQWLGAPGAVLATLAHAAVTTVLAVLFARVFLRWTRER